MRIGIDARPVAWYRIGGIATYTSELIRNLWDTRGDDDYQIVWPVPGPITELAGAGGEPVFVPSRDPRTADPRPAPPTEPSGVTEAAALAEAIRSHRLDVYHIPQNGIGLPAAVACPLVITLLDVIPLTLPQAVHPWYVATFSEQVPQAAARADAIITPSAFSRDDIRRTLGISADKLRVIPLAAASIFRPLDRAHAQALVKHKYQIEGDYILYVGGLSTRKNVRTLIEAFGRALRRLPRATSLVITGGPTAVPGEISRLVARLGLGGRVIFPGRPATEDLPYLYNAARLFVYLSLYEGFGLPPLEAMACGVPTLLADATSLPEVAGDGAAYADPRDPARVCDRILELLGDDALHRVMAARAVRRSRRFSWRRTAAMTRDVYGALTG